MTSSLPPYRTQLIAAGTLSNRHRSSMSDVTFQVFPLRADMARLRQFVDSYLNFVDEDEPLPFYFAPAVPYVMMEVIDYPNLAVTTENTALMAQHEVAFSIPLECYANQGGTRVFHQFGTCVPFLFLDQQPTIASGRDVFGLPKVALKFAHVETAFRPERAAQIANIQLRVPSLIGDQFTPFIEVYRDPPQFRSGDPIDDLMGAYSRAVAGWHSVMMARWEETLRSPLAGYDAVRDLYSSSALMRAMVDNALAGNPNYVVERPVPSHYASTADIQLGPIFIDNFSLKQVRDAEVISAACYQSLVRSAMYLDRIRGGGPLFDPRTGDPRSGILIKVYGLPSQNLVYSLGLEEADHFVTPNGRISTLRPFFPYWINVDLSYALGTNLQWRARDNGWSFNETLGAFRNKRTPYITFGSGALQERPQPVISPNTSLWILPLPIVDDEPGREGLRVLCQKYLENDDFMFTPIFDVPWMKPPNPGDVDWSATVWMVAYNLVNTTSGLGADREQLVEFVLPVFCEPKNGSDDGRFALVPLYVFSDNQSAAITDSEVYGRPTLLSEISGGPAPWYAEEVPALSVQTCLLPVLHSGSAPLLRELFEVRLDVKVSLPRPDPPESPFVPKSGGVKDLPKRGPIKDLMDGKSGLVPSIGLKQVVDTRLPELASYQALVLRRFRLSPSKPAAIDGFECTVRICRYESMPLVASLGLKTAPPSANNPGALEGDTTVDVVQVPFAMRVRAYLEQRDALNISWRAGGSGWNSVPFGEVKNRIDFKRDSWGPLARELNFLRTEFVTKTRALSKISSAPRAK